MNRAFDHAHDPPDARLQPRRIGDRTEAAVEDAVAAVGGEGLACRRQAQPRAGAETLEGRPGRFQPEGHDLDRNRCARTQPIYELLPVRDDREPPARGGDDLLAQQGAAKAFDQIERAAFHLVRPVDRQIELPMLGEGRERNARGCRLGCRALGGRNADELQALPVTLRERLDGKRRGRAGAEPDDHPVLHELHRGLGGCALERVAPGIGRRRAHNWAAAVALARMAAIAAA